METRTLDHVIYEQDGHIARIIPNNPTRASTQTSEMVHSVNEALDDAQYDHSVQVTAIKATMKDFRAGRESQEHMAELRKKAAKPADRV